jgi:V-type H+-transporting ATPase proteolipid subunit
MFIILFLTTCVLLPIAYLINRVKEGDIAIIGYSGILLALTLGMIGTAKGMISISSYVSGASLVTPRVATKSIFGIVICEAGMICTVLHVVQSAMKVITMKQTYLNNFLMMTSCIIVGSSIYFSCVSVGIICGIITMMDAKDPTLFFKIIVMEVIPAGIGVLGFVCGVIFSSKIDDPNFVK